MDKTRQILLNAYLDLSRESQDLRDMAYAKGILWVLFAEDRALSESEVSKSLGQLVGGSSIPKNALRTALKVLVMHKLATADDKEQYTISPAQKSEMQCKIAHSAEVSERILTNRFPNQIEKKTLKAWFDEVNSEYFSAGADKLMALYSKKAKPVSNVESILRPLIAKHDLQAYEKELIQGYREFLTSTEREEEEKVFYLISSVLSSKLVAANISPDFLSIDKYRNSEMLVDTNVLFGMRLYYDEELERAFNAFGAAAQALGIKLSIAKFSADEYERVRSREKDNFLILSTSYSEGILEGLNKNNAFVRAMSKLGCQSQEDIQRFFDSTLAIPKKMGDQDLTLLEGKQLRGGHYIEEVDGALLAEIRKETSKSENTAIHDLTLTKLATARQKSKKTFVLTLDSQMESFALHRIGDKEEPLWLSLYSLIQILAVNGGGPNFNPSELAPLIRIFIEFEESTNAEQYDERDLLLILEKTDRVNELPETQMISLLNKLHRTKLRRSPEEAVREITLEMDRALRQNSASVDASIKEKEETITTLQSEKGKLVDQLGDMGKSLVSERTRNVWIFFGLRVAGYLVAAGLVFWFILPEIEKSFVAGSNFDLVSEILLVLGILGVSITDYLSYVSPKLKEIKDSI